MQFYKAAAEYAATRGIIIADTKFEFGFIDGKLTLIDECLYTRFKSFFGLLRVILKDTFSQATTNSMYAIG